MRIKLRRPTVIETFIGVSLLVFVVGAALLLTRDSGPAVHTPAANVEARRPPAASFGDGRHEVLAMVTAGTYRTEGSTTAWVPLCSWKMFKAGRLVASGTATGPTSIVIEPMYDEVESSGCLTWRRTQ